MVFTMKLKTRQQLSAAANVPRIGKEAQNLPSKSRKSINTWAFLDEIEAPMWADLLALESDSTWDNKDEEWFLISHPIHQCSARELKSKFSLSLDLPEPSSPNLPTSVSKSRGKDYKSMKQEPLLCSLTIKEKQHFESSTSKSSLTNEVSEKKMKNNSEKLSEYKSDSLQQSLKSSASTITSEATSVKLIEASKNPFGPTGGVLFNLRNSLRKSYVTRQASRVEIKGMSSQSGQKSCSGKSSVGSTEYTGETPDSRNVLHKAPAAKTQIMSCKSDLRIKQKASKTMGDEKRTKGNITEKVNKSIPPVTAKSSLRARGINQSSRTVNGGKENQSGKLDLVTKSTMRQKGAKNPLQDSKAVNRQPLQSSERTKLVGKQENCPTGSKVEKPNRKVGTVYFR